MATLSTAVRPALDEERGEVWESVMESMNRGAFAAIPDPDHAAACSFLLRHLAYDVRQERGVCKQPPVPRPISGYPRLDRLH